MAKLHRFEHGVPGVGAPSVGALRYAVVLATAVGGLAAAGCSGTPGDTQTLQPQQFAISAKDAPVYSDQEMTLYERKLSVPLDIRRPNQAERQALYKLPKDPPFPHAPWVTNDDVQLQVTWTISNLDKDGHDVEFLVDPWNEFGRYWPGMNLTNAQENTFEPNLSGIDRVMHVDGTSAGDASRIHGTFTFSDMNELAIDFATVINIIDTLPPPDPANMDAYDSPATLVNHAFSWANRSYQDPLVSGYQPSTVPALTGFDIGLRTREPANLAVEFVIELVDKSGTGKVLTPDSTEKKLQPPTTYVTVGFQG